MKISRRYILYKKFALKCFSLRINFVSNFSK